MGSGGIGVFRRGAVGIFACLAMLHGVGWSLVAGVSELHMGPIFKGQAVQGTF